VSLQLLACDAQARPLLSAPGSPWTGYLCLADGRLVGGGGFAAPPQDGEVEIGYFTLPGWQRLGHGRRTAAALLAIARSADPGLTVIAHTLRSAGETVDVSASARILWSLGFGVAATANDVHAGPVWRWAAPPSDDPGSQAPNGPAPPP
jgi:ribosomal-protein-alanine N-acetyltransferase